MEETKYYEKQEDGSLKPLEIKPSAHVIQIAADYEYLRNRWGAGTATELLDLIIRGNNPLGPVW